MEVRRSSALFPAVLLTGPRQSGKTTLLKHLFGATSAYVSFDDPAQRSFVREDPNGFLDQFGDQPVILDEIQNAPSLFPFLKLRIDAAREKNGRYLMTGSQQFHLMQHVTESLAGRIAILDLLPFSILEHGGSNTPEQLIWNGGYPANALQPAQRDLWVKSYIQTYIERDVRALRNIADIGLFEQFLALLAARHGQELNMAEVAGQVGISVPTCKQWIGVLVASFIVFLLPPYHRNLGKRLVKSPKLYFLDSALAAELTRQPTSAALWSGAMGGAFFEGWVVSETRKILSSVCSRAGLYFWRSHDGTEVDLLIEGGDRIWPVEIKKTATPMPRHADALARFAAFLGEPPCGDLRIVCASDATSRLPHGVVALSWKDYPAWLLHVAGERG